MCKFCQFVCLVLLVASTAAAQVESLQIIGPHEVRPGQLVRLSANTLENETPFWIVLEPTDLDYEQVEQGGRLLFSSGCRSQASITVILLAQQVTEGRIATRQIRRTILVTTESGDRPNDPPEDPATRPPEKDPILQSPVYEAILQAWPKIRTDAARELSPGVAKNLEEVAGLCESEKFQRPDEIWRSLSSRNRKTLQVETTAWDPVAVALQTRFKQLSPQDVPSHALHLRAAATAIREMHQKHKRQRTSLPILTPERTKR